MHASAALSSLSPDAFPGTALRLARLTGYRER